jgi:uncharacterized membrane-anchored protein YhcB (DUF1043 family)
MYLLSRESGIFTYSKNRIYELKGKFKLPEVICYDMEQDNKGDLWIGTNHGLMKISLEKENIKVYNTSNGLISNTIYDVAINTPYIYLSTEEGIIRFPLDQDLSNPVSPYISLNRTQLNGSNTTYASGMILPYDHQTVSFQFYTSTYKDQDKTKLFYQLKGRESKTGQINKDELVLSKLSPGNYKLTVYAINNDGIKSTVPIVLLFKVAKPFWTTLWFIILVAFTGIACVYFIIRIITQSNKKKEQKKTELNRQINEHRLNAIQAQMNPHFIFNAINSIQHYILSNKTQAAYDYLAKFSKLIRLVLANSQHNAIRLTKEIEILELYIELEQQRFKHKFEYNIYIDKEIDLEEIKIPVMLIQPFVENAIWHGIMNLDQSVKGKLSIGFYLSGETLRIVVEDNGIGRKRAGELKTLKSHESIGVEATEKRIALLKSARNKEAKILFTDLFDRNNIAAGTKVEIWIPI